MEEHEAVRTRRERLAGGVVIGCVVPTTISFVLFLTSDAGGAFDQAFTPLLVATAAIGLVLLIPRPTRLFGVGVMAGAVVSLVVQFAAMLVYFVVVT